MPWTSLFRPSLAMRASMTPTGPRVLSVRQFYTMLDYYYQNVDLYENLRTLLVDCGEAGEKIVGLKNPVNRVVEFYAKKIWPGALPQALMIVADHPEIADPIRQVDTWSNFAAMKQVLAREAALYGNCFAKVATINEPAPPGQPLGSAKRVYKQRIDPKAVTAFREDERGFIAMIRLDTEGYQTPDGGFLALADADETVEFDIAAAPLVVRTEVWDKVRMRVWTHARGLDARIGDLGPPEMEMPLSTWNIDFVPFVRAPFRDIGDKLGVSCFQHALDKINVLNRDASRMHKQLYRGSRETWAIESDLSDKAGRPVPALSLDDLIEEDEEGEPGGVLHIKLGDEVIWTLPGTYHLKTLVPPLPYDAMLAILQDDLKELEDDLPEMAYYRTRDLGTQLSGVALRLILGPAVDTVIEARGNLEAANIRLNQMALTIGANLGLFELGSLTYENGGFNHSFADRPVVPLTEVEEAQLATAKQTAGVPRRQVLIDVFGYSEEQVDRWEQDRQQAADQVLAQAQAQRAQFALQQDQAAAQAQQQGIRDRIQQGQQGQQDTGTQGGGNA